MVVCKREYFGFLVRAFGAALCVLSLVLLVSVSLKNVHVPIDYDEAYNLQVVDSLSKGKGYSTFGVLRGSGPWDFDPYITTGPVVLLPLAAVWFISEGSVVAVRLTMLLFLWAYVSGVVVLFRQGRYSAVLAGFALAVVLSANTLQAARVLGELPAAALLVWAAVGIQNKRLIIAGLLIGLAIQAKLVFGLAGIIIFSAVFLLRLLGVSGISMRAIFMSGMMVIAPSLIFEFCRYMAVGGLSPYIYSLEELRSFLALQNINTAGTWLEPGLLGAKFSGLYFAMSKGGWLAVFTAAILGLLFFAVDGYGTSLGMTRGRKCADAVEASHGTSTSAIVVAFVLTAGIGMLLGWIMKSSQAGARQGLPFLLLAVPAVMSLAIVRLYDYGKIGSGLIALTLSFVTAALFCLLAHSLVSNVFATLEQDSVRQWDEQRRVSDIIRRANPDSLFVDGWWQNPEYQLLSGVRALPMRTGHSQLLVVQDYQVHLLKRDWSSYESRCAQSIYRSSFNLVCWLPEFEYRNAAIKIVDWGPRNAKMGRVPNIQNDGGVGLWVKIENVDFEKIGPIRVYFSGRPTRMDYLHADGEVITASIPPEYYKAGGSHEITLVQATTGRRYHVGYFVVE